MMRVMGLGAAIAALGGCAPEVGLRALDGPGVLSRAAQPVYLAGPHGAVVPASCLGAAPAPGALPPRCALDSAFAAQAARTSDLVHPRHPGAPLAAPTATAAYDYAFGDGAAERPAVLGGGPGTADGRDADPLPPTAPPLPAVAPEVPVDGAGAVDGG